MIYTRGEFLKLIGKLKRDGTPDYAWLFSYVSRGELILTEDKKVDDDIILNRAFAQKWISRKEPHKKQVPDKVERPGEYVNQDPDAQQVPQRKRDASDEDPGEGYLLDLEKKKAEIERITRNNRLLELKEAKIMGEILPVALIEQVFQVHGQSIITAHKAGIESLLVQVAAEARLSGVQLANLRGKMIDSLNAAVEKATAISDQAITAILSDYVNQKEVGEHE